MSNAKKIAIIGLGYVGLPLAVEFSKVCNVIGFDINKDRIRELKEGYDRTLEVDLENIDKNTSIEFSANPLDLSGSDIFIVTVPTPVTISKQPDLNPLINASKLVAKYIKPGSIIIYESTVYPGATEEVCVPLLELESGLKFNKDFFCGYSPERINPGDKINTLTKIKKVTSGSTPEIAKEIDNLYKSIITAGTFSAKSIKVAEAAKIIENTQRDLNIALANELSLIFRRLNIDTLDVIEAASTKWNFLPFKPGLVGGHCISVDPYYLTYKAEMSGYYPEIILAGRRVNNSIVNYIANETIKLMINKKLEISGGKILILGFSFKENCPDIRNTKVMDLLSAFSEYNVEVDIYDPWINVAEVEEEYKIKCLNSMPNSCNYSAIIVSVGHKIFIEMGVEKIKSLGVKNCVLFDVKGVLDPLGVDLRL